MIIERRFRSVRVPLQVFYCCAICLERMGVTLTKKEILKEDGDDFDGIIEGKRGENLIVRIKVHGWRDMDHHGGFWPTSRTTDLTTETFEVSENNEELPDTLNANALDEEFNDRIGKCYLWGTSG